MGFAGGIEGFRSDRRGVSGPVGYIIVLSIVIVGTTTIVVLGATALDDTQANSEFKRAEHSMTLFDSRAAMVALGDANVQSVSVSQDSGSFRVDDEAGWIRVTHRNYSADASVREEVIFNESLGRAVYENDDRELAYQGGGVWRLGEGEARMVAPPEFHYRGATLTLPIIRTTGGSSGAGTGDVTVRAENGASTVYPNTTSYTGTGNGAPYDHNGREYANPVENGSVNVTVKSRYYEGWATFFEDRTEGKVTTDAENNTVKLELLTLGGEPGEFGIPPEGESVLADGIAEGHSIQNFDVELAYTDGTNDHFSFYDSDTNEEFELHVLPESSNYQNACDSGSPPTSDVYVGVYYYDGDGSQEYEFWETSIPDSSSATSWSCDGDTEVLNLDLLSTDPAMDYDQNAEGLSCGGGGNKWRFNEHIKESCEGFDHGDATLEAHESTISWEGSGTTYSEPDTSTGRTLGEITNHYMTLMGPDMTLTSQMGPGGSRAIIPAQSEGDLQYESPSGTFFITYLHITENRIEVEVD